MTTPSAPNPNTVNFDQALAQNPSLANDPATAYPLVTTTQDPTAQTQVANASLGQYFASYLTNLPAPEQATAWANMSASQQQLATAGGYTSALTNVQAARVADPQNQHGPSFLGRLFDDAKGALGSTVGAVSSAVGTGLGLLNTPLHEVQRGTNAAILGITDALEGNPIGVQSAWQQAGSAPMTQDSLNELDKKYGPQIMGMVRQVQQGQDPVGVMAAQLKQAQGSTDPAAITAAQTAAQTTENLYNSSTFKQALTEANNHLISPGRVTAGFVSDLLDKATAGHVDLNQKAGGALSAFGILSGSVDALFDFNADPLMVAGKLFAETNAVRYGLNLVKGGAEDVGAGLLEGAGEAAPGLVAGAEAGAEGGSVAGPEGTVAGAVGGAVVGGAAGVIGHALSSVLHWGEKGGTTVLAKKVASAVGARGGTDNAPISDMAGFTRRIDNLFDPTTSAGANVNRYFNGMTSHISTIVNNPGTDQAAAALQGLRRDYPRFAPYLDSMISQGVTDVDKAKAYFQTAKGYELLVQGSAASRVPLMAYRTNLQQKYLQLIPRASTVFDWLENGHKLTEMPATSTALDDLATQVSPESRALAQSATDLAAGSTTAQNAVASAAELSKTTYSGNLPVLGAWRAKAGTLLKRLGSKIPDYEGDQMDLSADNSTQNFVNLVKVMAPSWYADRVGATFSAADIAGRKNIYKSVMGTLFDASGITKTADGMDAAQRVLKAVDDSDTGVYSLGEVGKMTAGQRSAYLLSQARPYVPAIPVKEIFAQGAKHGVFSHTVGITNAGAIDKAVDNIWRPFVLLRPAFAFRSSIEEAVNHVFRVGMTDKLKGMLSRSALNKIEMDLKTEAAGKADSALDAHQALSGGMADKYGVEDGTDVSSKIRAQAAKAADPAVAEQMRTDANAWDSSRLKAETAKTEADAMPGVFDPDHSRLMRFLASSITRPSQLATHIWRKIPIDTRFGSTSGGEIRAAQLAHETTAKDLAAQTADSKVNLANASEAFTRKHGYTVAEATDLAENSANASEKRLAKTRLTAYNKQTATLKEDLLSKQLAEQAHGAEAPEVLKARDNAIQGFADRRTMNMLHFMGKVGLAYVQKSSPEELGYLWDLAKSPRGEEIVNHAITEMSARTARSDTTDLGPIGKRAAYKRVGLGPYKGIDPNTTDGAGDLGAHAWSWSLDLLAQDPAARAAMLHADNTGDAIKAIKDVVATNPAYKRDLRVLSVKSEDEYAQQMLDEVRHHLGIGAAADGSAGPLNKDLFNSLVKTDANGFRTLNEDAYHPQELSKVLPSFRPDKVFGRDSMLVEDNSKGGFFSRLTQEGFRRVGTNIAYMSRQDQYLREYVNMRKVMKPWEDMTAQHFTEAWNGEDAAANAAHEDYQGGTVGAVEQQLNAERAKKMANDMAIDHSTIAAWGRTLQFLDHPGVRTQSAVLMRNMAPFWRAQQGFLARWAKSFRYSPQMVAKMDLATNYIENGALTHRDADGNPYMTLPISGALQWTLGKMGNALGMDLQNIPMPTITGNLLLSSPGFNVDFLKHPLTGPVVTLPLQTIGMLTHGTALEQLFPSTDDILDGAAGGVSVGQNPLMQMLPSALRPLVQAVLDQGGTSQTFTHQAIAMLQASGKGLPDVATDAQKQQYLDRLQTHSTGIALLEALIKPFDPMPVHNEAPITATSTVLQKNGLQNVKNEFNQLVKDTGNYQMAYQYWIQAHPDEIPFLTSANQSESGATIPQTQQAFDWMSANQGLLKMYPAAAAFLIPQATPGTSQANQVNYGPFQLAQTLGLDSAISNKDYLAKVQVQSNIQWYYNLQDQKAAELAQVGSNSSAATAIRAKYAPYEAGYQALHPSSYDYINGGASRAVQRTDTVQQLAQLLQDPKVDTSTPQAQAAQNMLNLYGQFQYSLNAITARGATGTAAKAQVVQEYDTLAQQLAGKDMTSAMLYNNLFRYMESTTVNNQAMGGVM